MNETLCRALVRAGLTEEDAATHLGVDPKTVRRWMEGRALPYPRHRWALAAMLGTDEADLWPQLHARSRPAEVQAVYPHRDDVPIEVWLRLLDSATREIDVLDDMESVSKDRGILAVLADRAKSGVRVRICIDNPGGEEADLASKASGIVGISVDPVLALFAPLCDARDVDIRLCRTVLYNSIYRADSQLLVAQRAHGIVPGRGPALHLSSAKKDDLASTYVHTFSRIWAGARPPA